jgi:tryptophanyl-tRNA synthetase
MLIYYKKTSIHTYIHIHKLFAASFHQIKRCKTDDFVGLEWDNPTRPEATNLLNIYRAVSGKSREDIEEQVKDLSWSAFKPLLADAVVEHLLPIQKRYQVGGSVVWYGELYLWAHLNN